MQDRSLKQRLMFIGAIILVGVLLITPPSKRLLPGLDIAGGTSLIFEIEEEPGENNPLLAEQMKELLQRRVDPQGVYDLVWRVVGRNRLEVQMPLPPAENARLKEEFQKALDDLSARNLKPSQISAIGAAPAESREAEMNKLLDDSAVKDYLSKTYSGDELNRRLTRLAELQDQRRKDLQEAVAAADAREKALATVREALATQPAGSQPSDETYQAIRTKLSDAEADVADANDALFKHNVDLTSLRDVLDMDEKSKPRKDGLAERRSTYAHLEPQIAAVVEKYDAWRAKRVLLEGSADLIRLLRGAGVLEFRILVEPPPADNVTKYDRYREQLAREGPRPQQNDTEQWFRIDNPLSFFALNTLAELNKLDPKTFPYHVIDKKDSNWYVLSSRKAEDGLLATKGGGRPWKLVGAHASRDQRGRPSVNFQLDAVGGSQFRELTRRNIGRQLCIFVDDVAYSSANIHSEIGTSGEITGDFSSDKIRYLIQTMQAGSLPGRLKDTPISERTIGSSLGEENLRQALFAGLVGLALVLVVMIGYYAVAGMVANVALLMNVLLVLAAMAMLGARFNLAGIAGVILGVGMAVDANVLIYERMREERERGSSLRMIIKNGYEKAFSTIFDSNVTTLLTCAILYYVGSEEIKGFGLTLGWGVVLNLFTAVFVTRVVFTVLTRYNLIKDLKMMKLIGVPNIDWYGKRRIFIPLSVVINVVGLALLVMRGSKDTMDVEFLGGVNAEVQVKKAFNDQFDDAKLRGLIEAAGTEIENAGRQLAQATVSPIEGEPAAFKVSAPGVSAPLLLAMVAEPLESGESGKLLQPRVGAQAAPGGEDAVILRVKNEVTAESLRNAIVALADNTGDSLPGDGENVRRANIGQVRDVGAQAGGKAWSITTVCGNKKLVQYALVSALGDKLDTKPRVTYVFHGNGDQPYPITEKLLAELPGMPPGVQGNLTDFYNGAAIHLDELNPPQDVDVLRTRLRNMRLQPDYADIPYRTIELFGVTPTGAKNEDGHPLFSSVVVAVFDDKHPYSGDASLWASEFAMPEKALVQAALENEQTLRRVTSFKPQIASQSRNKALVAVGLSWLMIIAYMWVRFGKMRYGVAGVVALVHDVCIALSFIGISGWIGGVNHPLGSLLLIEDFKIDMTIIAAIMTIIGFSINDTIVIFDRVRETRGRLGRETIDVVNRSINETLSRTVLTTGTVMLTLIAMYIFGGIGIRGFTFCMVIGCITGTYSTLAIASPLLLWGMVSSDEEKAYQARLATA